LSLGGEKGTWRRKRRFRTRKKTMKEQGLVVVREKGEKSENRFERGSP